MKKICILTSIHPAKDARIFYKQACSLVKAGFEVALIAQAPNDVPPSDVQLEEGERDSGVRFFYFPAVLGRRQRWSNRKRIFAMACAQKADAYLFHDPDLIGVGLKLQKKLGRPVVYDVHEYYGDSLRSRQWIPKLLRPLLAAGFDCYEKWAARRLAGIMTVNEHMAAQFAGVNPKGVVLYNYALRHQYDFPEPTQERFAGLPHIIYVGSLNRERGLEVILAAMPWVMERFPEARCTLVGEVDTAGLDARFLPLEPWLERGRIELTGVIPYQRVPDIISTGTVALVPLLATLNYIKAIPVKLIEYMAAGVPVVGSGFGHIERIVTESGCGVLAEAGDPQGLAEAICALIEDRERAWQCAGRGYRAFRECYSWESEEPKLVSFFKDVILQI